MRPRYFRLLERVPIGRGVANRIDEQDGRRLEVPPSPSQNNGEYERYLRLDLYGSSRRHVSWTGPRGRILAYRVDRHIQSLTNMAYAGGLQRVRSIKS